MATMKIDHIEDYTVCPARAYMNMTLQERPVKQRILESARKGLYDVILSSLGQDTLNHGAITRAIENMVSIPGFTQSDYDVSYLGDIFSSFSKLLSANEYTLTGGVIPFEISAGQNVIQSAIDFTVKDEARGYVFPALLDFSRTRYEPFYNPIVYRAETVVRHMDIMRRNTEVLVFLPYGSKPKVWQYEKVRLSSGIYESLTLMGNSISDDCFYHRVGWWCAGCPYRGICFKIMSGRKKQV